MSDEYSMKKSIFGIEATEAFAHRISIAPTDHSLNWPNRSWNPLDEIRLSTEAEVGDAELLAAAIMASDDDSSHWVKTSIPMLTAVILHALYKAKNGDISSVSLNTITSILTTKGTNEFDAWDVSGVFTEMSTYGHVNGEVHPAVSTAVRDMAGLPETERSAVIVTVHYGLKQFIKRRKVWVTLCGEGVDISDRIMELKMKPDDAALFVKLVKHGGREAGFIKPSVILTSILGEQTLSERDGWEVDSFRV